MSDPQPESRPRRRRATPASSLPARIVIPKPVLESRFFALRLKSLARLAGTLTPFLLQLRRSILPAGSCRARRVRNFFYLRILPDFTPITTRNQFIHNHLLGSLNPCIT